MKKLLIALVTLFLFPITLFAQVAKTGDNVSLSSPGNGTLDIFTSGTGPINFGTNGSRRLTIDGTTGALEVVGDTFDLAPGGDANRLISLGATSDTNMFLKWGDAAGAVGGTPAQLLSIVAQTADTDDDSALRLAAGGAGDNENRGAYITMYGNEYTSTGGDMYISAGNVNNANLAITAPATNGTIGLITNGSTGLSISSGQVVTVANQLIQTNGYLQSLKGEALDADVTATSPTSNTSAYLASDQVGNQLAFIANQADATGSQINAFKTRALTLDANTVVASGDDLFKIVAFGSDGTSYQTAALILMESDGTPGASDMPGRIVFQTTPDGSATLAEAFRVTSSQVLQASQQITSTRTTDLGWAVVDSTNNTACNSICTSAAVFGFALTGDTAFPITNFVGPADATADICLCAGAS